MVNGPPAAFMVGEYNRLDSESSVRLMATLNFSSPSIQIV